MLLVSLVLGASKNWGHRIVSFFSYWGRCIVGFFIVLGAP